MKKVISFSLYGSDTRYTQNALINSKKAEEIFPDWTVVIYYDNTVPKNVIDFLSSKKHIEMINMENYSIKNKRLWRFSILLDKTVDIYIIRDIDSHLSFREKYAVDEWIESKKKFHVMRDHPSHCSFPISCGMWGGRHDIHLGKIFNNTYLKYNENQYIYDTNLVNNEFWNYIKQDVLVHDSFQLQYYGECKPFPQKRIGLEHVGSVILNGKIRECDGKILSDHLHLEKNR